MEKRWRQDEESLYGKLLDPRPDLRRRAYLANRKARHMPAGKQKAKLAKQVHDDRQAIFAAGWKAYEQWIAHEPPG